MTHRNAEIWEKRHERLEHIRRDMDRHFAQAERSPHWGEKSKAVATMWVAKFKMVESRVWNALCVAKGWRKA